MTRTVIVAVFDNRNQAYATAREIQAFGNSAVDVKSGAILEKDALGNVVTLDSKHIGSAWGGLAGVASGALLGALIGLLAGPGGAALGSAAGAAAAGSGAATGGLVGGTLGASADFISTGEKQDYLAMVRRRLLPGKTALVAEVHESSIQPVDLAVAGHGGVLYRTPLDS